MRSQLLGLAVSCGLLLGILSSCSMPSAPVSGTAGVVYSLTRCGGSVAAPHATSAATPSAQPALYIATGGAKLYALAPESGAIRWCIQFASPTTPPPGFCASGPCPHMPGTTVGGPLVVDGVLYVCVSGPANDTYALNAADGALRWMRKTGCGASIPMEGVDLTTPVLGAGMLFSGSYALDPRTGAERWRLPDGLVPGAVADNQLYAYSSYGVSAWNVKSGKIVWRYTLPDPIADAPTVANGVVYVGDIGGDSAPVRTPNQPDTFALDARTGRLLWRASTGIVTGSPLGVGGAVYVGGIGPALFALDATTGRIRWRHNTATAGPSAPVAQDGVVYFTADGVYAVDASSGALRWRQAMGASQSVAFTEVALAHGELFMARMDGMGLTTLYALNPDDGSVLWRRDGLTQLSLPMAAT